MSDSVEAKLIDGQSRTIRQLFTGRKYGLDFYQREYTWTDANVGELVDDLATGFLDSFDASHERPAVAQYDPYFLGPIVTSAHHGTLFIVDGQQRLTTLTLVLVHLHHLTRDDDTVASLSDLVFSQQYGQKTFNINVDERDPVMRAILDEQPFDPSEATESVRNMWHRYNELVEIFPDDLKGDALPYFVDWLLDRVVLVEIATTDQEMALEIFETMNDRGLRLSNTDMLKGFVLARIADPKRIEAANDLWRDRVQALTDLEKNADSEFLKAWLRGKYAVTIRERRKDATSKDFELIGTAFHKWVRDNQSLIGLEGPTTFAHFVNHDFRRMSERYETVLKASQQMRPGFEHVFYNATTGLTLQFLPIMAAVTPDDDADTFRAKTRLVASYLDVFISRRMVNFRNFGYSTIVYSIFLLAKAVRNKDLDSLRDVLADRVAEIEEGFDAVSSFRLTQRNRSHIRYLLGRMTAWLEEQVGPGPGFAAYVDRNLKKPYEVEHIWADKYDRHTDEFPSVQEFSDTRDRIGDLLLLPKDFNASYGAMTYEEKLPHYYGQNLLAASLHPRTYTNNPSFRSLLEETGLPFRPYPNGFRRQEVEERQELYRQIMGRVWSLEVLGLEGGTPSTAAESETRKAFYDVSVADLVEAGFLQVGDELRGTRAGVAYSARIVEDARVGTTDRGVFRTLSGAADALTGKSCNGWTFWSVARSDGYVLLDDLRSRLLNQAPENEGDSPGGDELLH